MSPDGEDTVDPAVARYADAWRERRERLQPLVAPFKGVLLENKTWTLSVHYRAADDGIVPRLRAIVDDVAGATGFA